MLENDTKIQYTPEDLSDGVLKKAVEAELNGFESLVTLKVSDNLVQQLYKQGETAEINALEVSMLLESLFSTELTMRSDTITRIKNELIPHAEENPEPSKHIDIYSQYDLPKLDFYVKMHEDVKQWLENFAPSNEDEYVELAEQYISDLLPKAIDEVQRLPAEQAAFVHAAAQSARNSEEIKV